MPGQVFGTHRRDRLLVRHDVPRVVISPEANVPGYWGDRSLADLALLEGDAFMLAVVFGGVRVGIHGGVSVGVLWRDRRGTRLARADVGDRAVGMPKLVLQFLDGGNVRRVVVRIVTLARRCVLFWGAG
jgi:hypothetical protein